MAEFVMEQSQEYQALQRELERVKQQRDKLRKALSDCMFVLDHNGDYGTTYKNAKQALKECSS